MAKPTEVSGISDSRLSGIVGGFRPRQSPIKSFWLGFGIAIFLGTALGFFGALYFIFHS